LAEAPAPRLNAIASVLSKCPHCHHDLKTTLKEELVDTVEVARFLINPAYDRLFQRPPTEEPYLSTAYQFLRLQRGGESPRLLTAGDARLDRVLGGFHLCLFVVLYGSSQAHVLSERLCMRARLPRAQGGLEADVLFLDGGNLFDPYLLSDFARQSELDPFPILDGIHVSRAFTHPQLTTLITQKLPEAVDKYHAKLVVISDIISLYLDQPSRMRDIDAIFRKVLTFLSILAQRKRIIVVATHLTSTPKSRSLETKLFRHAQTLIHLKDGPTTTLHLEKHPYLPPTTLPPTRPTTQPPTYYFH